MQIITFTLNSDDFVFFFKIFTRWDLGYKTYNILMTSVTAFLPFLCYRFYLCFIHHFSPFLTDLFIFLSHQHYPTTLISNPLKCFVLSHSSRLVSPRVDIKASSSMCPCCCCPYMCVCMCACVCVRQREGKCLLIFYWPKHLRTLSITFLSPLLSMSSHHFSHLIFLFVCFKFKWR